MHNDICKLLGLLFHSLKHNKFNCTTKPVQVRLLQQMFEISSFSFKQAVSLFRHSSTASSAILCDSPFHVSCVAASDRSRLELWRLMNTILHNTSYSTTGLRSGLFGGHIWLPNSPDLNPVYIWSNEFRSFTLKELDRLMRWSTVLLEYVSVTSNGTNGWQHLLLQYDVAIITATNLSARI